MVNGAINGSVDGETNGAKTGAARPNEAAAPAAASAPLVYKNMEWLCPSLTDEGFDPLYAFGMASWLWTQSTMHMGWSVSLLGTTIWPAIVHRQFMLARDKQRRPVAYVSWAMFDEAREQQYLRDANSLQAADWVSGDRVWFMDWIAPFGGTLAVARKIENDIFPDSAGHSLHVKDNRKQAIIRDHFGKNVSIQRKQLAIEQLTRNLAAAFASAK